MDPLLLAFISIWYVAKAKAETILVFTKIRASEVEFTKKHASQIILEPVQKHALSRSMQLKIVYLKVLLY